MRKLYIAILFLIISIGLCAYEQITLIGIYDKTTTTIDEILDSVNNDDYNSAQNACDELIDYWNKKYLFMTSTIDHGQIDNLSVNINSLDEYAKNNSDELVDQLITVKNEMSNLYNNQKLSLGNIF